MNGANMPAMNPLAGAMPGGPMQMMNNAQMAQPNGPRQPQVNEQNRGLLNTYIYEYFVRYGMYDCARAMLQTDAHVKVKDGANGRRDENGNGNALGDDPMETDSKEDMDSKRPDDLPAPSVPMPLPDSCFLYEWFCLFWDMFNAQKGKGAMGQVGQYVNHTQNTNRLRQAQQQDLLRGMRPGMEQQAYQAQMMRNMQNSAMNMNMKQGNHLQRTAMANSQANPGSMQMMQNKQGQMQREPSDMDGSRIRPGSPGSADNAPSPSKRPRIGEAGFNPGQGGAMMPNGMPSGRPMGGQGQQVGGPGSITAQRLLIENGINPAGLNLEQIQNFQAQNAATQQKTVQTYAQNLSQHHANLSQTQSAQMMGKSMPGQQPQGSPLIPQGPDGSALMASYNPGPDGMMGPNGVRPAPPGVNGGPGGTSHALQDYQVQLMLLEQQNKKRLMMARAEQDTSVPGAPMGSAGPGMPPGANGAFQGASPQGGRNGASPNPAEQLKRANQMVQGGSPLPDGSQGRISPNAMNFVGGPMDPAGAPHFAMGPNGNMVMSGQVNGMRPPNGPGGPQQGFGQQPMTAQQQQFFQARQAQMVAQQSGQGMPPGQWQQQQLQLQQQQGANGGAVPLGGMLPQGQAQQQLSQGTPQQQRAMPPPAQPAGQVAANARSTASPQATNAAPPTPQQSTKNAPKKKEPKNAKNRNASTKKSSSNLNNAAATPVADSSGDGDAAAPATPMTPGTATFKPGQNPPMPVPPVQASQVTTMIPTQPADANPNAFGLDVPGQMDYGLDFVTNPALSGDVIADFDFETFLHDGEQHEPGFEYPGSFGLEDAGEVGAE